LCHDCSIRITGEKLFGFFFGKEKFVLALVGHRQHEHEADQLLGVFYRKKEIFNLKN
jgi:hypothetical protein